MVLQLNKSTVRFLYSPGQPVKNVLLAGNFNNWEPVSMAKQKDGYFVRNLKLSAGTYEYKFIIDGAWIHDPDHNHQVYNSLGSLNSVLVVI